MYGFGEVESGTWNCKEIQQVLNIDNCRINAHQIERKDADKSFYSVIFTKSYDLKLITSHIGIFYAIVWP